VLHGSLLRARATLGQRLDAARGGAGSSQPHGHPAIATRLALRQGLQKRRW
jgi:hypothetical protein